MIDASNLTKFYGDRAAIRDVSFTIDEGDIVGFLGLNGAGKTTTLRIISCQLVPSSGTVEVSGLNVLERPHEIRQRIGYLPETPPLYQDMTVRSYLEFAAQIKGISSDQTRQCVAEVEEVTKLGEVRDQVIGTLSHGYKQRVGIAQAVVHKPKLIILDEPFTGLDPKQTKEMREMIHGLGGDHTVLLSSHRLEQIERLCDKLIVLDQSGQVGFQGTEDEFVALARGSAIQLKARGGLNDVTQAVETIEGIAASQGSELPKDVAMLTIQAELGRKTFPRQRPEGSPSVEEHDDLCEAVAAALYEAGLPLRELKRADNEMESVFVQLTHEERGESSRGEASLDEDVEPDDPSDDDEEES